MNNSLKLTESHYLILNKNDKSIIEEIEKTLITLLPTERDVEKHLKRHSLKYLWLIDQILSKNIKHNKSPSSPQVIDYNTLYERITNKLSIKLKDRKKITLAKLILLTLQEAKLIKKTREPDHHQGIASEYKVLSINKNKLNSFPIMYFNHNKMQMNFIKKIQTLKKNSIETDSLVKTKMLEWMEKLDFSSVNRKNLSKNHLLILEYYQNYKFQVQGSTGRIYNSFTNLPRKIREHLRVDGNPLGQLDLANAQAIFLCQIIVQYLQENDEVPSKETLEFICWSELGKSFEFINSKLDFESGQKRTFFKKKFWQCIMDKNENMDNYVEVFQSMEKNIPQILEVVQKIKYKNHKKMAFELQKRESNIMISIFEKIMIGKTCSLLHDAIYFPVNILKQMRGEFIEKAKNMGVNCTVKIEYKKDRSNFLSKETHLTFLPSKTHLEIIKKYRSMFNGYPLDLLDKSRSFNWNVN